MQLHHYNWQPHTAPPQGEEMPLAERQELMSRVESLRGGRTVIAVMNFDRRSEPEIPGLATKFEEQFKESLFRVLKETHQPGRGIDVFLYTRGGDLQAVWPICSIIREFDPEFQVLVPFRCHSAGTILSLGARRIVMGRLAELSPIDPTGGNQFNPTDKGGKSLGISVEDVQAFRRFVLGQFGLSAADDPTATGIRKVLGRAAFRVRGVALLGPFLSRLTDQVHPLALGSIHRTLMLIERLAGELLRFHPIEGRDVHRVVRELTTSFYSHVHMINRHEARSLLGEQVEFASPDLDAALDQLLRCYEDDFTIRNPLFLASFMGTESNTKDVRFVGGAVESRTASYQFVTEGLVFQFTRLPPGVQMAHNGVVNPFPIIPGLERAFSLEVRTQGWIRNKQPKGHA